MAAILQPDVVADFVPGAANALIESVEAVWQAMATGFSIETGVAEIDSLVSRGGMASMLSTIWLIIGAVTFGALLDELGLLRRLIDPLIDAARTTARLFAAAFASAFGLNIFAGDQYIALVLPIRLYRTAFDDRGLDPRNLSRLAADSGTVTSALVPWNSCGAFMAAVLGVATLDYLPFAIFNYTSPLINLLLGITGVGIARVARTGTTRAPRFDDGGRASR
jgi:NhaC family Na+:H+ antiporter